MAFLNDQDAAFIRQRLEQDLDHDVALEFFAPATGGLALPGEDTEMAEYTRQILSEIAQLSPKVQLNVHSTITDPESAQRYGIARTPATAIVGAEDYGVRFYGMPAGYEFATLLEVILDVSRGQPPLSELSRETLPLLQDDALIQVFVTPT